MVKRRERLIQAGELKVRTCEQGVDLDFISLIQREQLCGYSGHLGKEGSQPAQDRDDQIFLISLRLIADPSISILAINVRPKGVRITDVEAGQQAQLADHPEESPSGEIGIAFCLHVVVR